MFLELNNMCEISAKDGISPGKCILVDGCHEADSSFVLHHFVSMYSKCGHTLCFLGLSQSFNHYNSVGNKLGASLASARDSGNLMFIEGLKLIGEDILRNETETQCAVDATSGGNLVNFASVNHNGLKNLYQHCKYCINDLAKKFPEKPLLLVIDDITILSLLGLSPMDVIHFVTYLRSLMSSNKGSVLIQTQCSGDEDDIDIIRQHIHHQSDIVFTVQGLPSGYSKDVHGQLTVRCRSNIPESSRTTSKSMQYKILDKSVTFFAAGLSSAVL